MLPGKWVILRLALAAACLPLAARPAQAGTWEMARMPGYASVRAFASVPAGLLAGTDSGGIYLTENEGADWGRVWRASGNDMSESIVGFLAGDSVILAASGWVVDLGLWDCWSPCSRHSRASGILRSRDGGRTWNHAGLANVTAMVRLQNAAILAATLQGFYLSGDWGATWRPLAVTFDPGSALTAQTLKSYAVREMAPMRGEAYFTLSSPGLHRIYPGSGGDTTYRIQTVLTGAIGVAGAKDTLYASTPTAILRAAYRGGLALAWDTVAHAAITRITAAPGRLLGMPIPKPSYAPFSEGIRQSVDGGRTWTTASSPASNGLAFIQHGKSLYWGSAAGPVLRCAPGGEWAYASDGLFDQGVSGIALPEASVLAVVEGYRLLQRGPGPGGAWSQTREGSGLQSLVARGEEAFVVQGRRLFSSQRAGAPGTWDSLDMQSPRSVVAGEGWQLVLQSDGLRSLCASGTCEAPIAGDLPAEKDNGLYFNNRLRAAATAGDTVYLALDSLYRSDDRGRTFRFLSPFRTLGLALLGGKPHVLTPYIAGDTGDFPSRIHLIVSQDGGRNWSRDIEAGIRGLPLLRFLASRPGELFCAGDSGVFARKEGDSAWTDLSQGLPPGKIRAMAVEGDRLAVAMEYGPIWLRDLEPGPIAIRSKARTRPDRIRAAGPGTFRDHEGRWRRLDGGLR